MWIPTRYGSTVLRANFSQAPAADTPPSPVLQLPPPGLACDLLPHQIAGLAWLKKRESADSPLNPEPGGTKAGEQAEEGEELTELKMPERDPKKEAAAAKKKEKQKKAGAQTEKFGGILADDMGLGKTVQMSA